MLRENHVYVMAFPTYKAIFLGYYCAEKRRAGNIYYEGEGINSIKKVT